MNNTSNNTSSSMDQWLAAMNLELMKDGQRVSWKIAEREAYLFILFQIFSFCLGGFCYMAYRLVAVPCFGKPDDAREVLDLQTPIRVQCCRNRVRRGLWTGALAGLLVIVVIALIMLKDARETMALMNGSTINVVANNAVAALLTELNNPNINPTVGVSVSFPIENPVQTRLLIGRVYGQISVVSNSVATVFTEPVDMKAGETGNMTITARAYVHGVLMFLLMDLTEANPPGSGLHSIHVYLESSKWLLGESSIGFKLNLDVPLAVDMLPKKLPNPYHWAMRMIANDGELARMALLEGLRRYEKHDKTLLLYDHVQFRGKLSQELYGIKGAFYGVFACIVLILAQCCGIACRIKWHQRRFGQSELNMMRDVAALRGGTPEVRMLACPVCDGTGCGPNPFGGRACGKCGGRGQNSVKLEMNNKLACDDRVECSEHTGDPAPAFCFHEQRVSEASMLGKPSLE